MITDIFSSFDPISFNSTLPSTRLILFINLAIIYFIHGSPYLGPTQFKQSLAPAASVIIAQLNRTHLHHLKHIVLLTSSLFTTIIAINIVGLIPYFFSITSHLIFTLTYGFPLWLRIIISSISKAPIASIAHFLPDGAPDWLNPFLVLIETTRFIVRPLTLSFRLAANIRAGHIVLRLIGIYCAAAWFSSHIAFFILILLTVGYILFEIAICFIQAYIFALLLSLYRDDHVH